MDIKAVLSYLIEENLSLPALKLKKGCEKDTEEDHTIVVPKIPPSHYLREHSLTTKERNDLLSCQLRKFNYAKHGAEIVAQPAIVVFQNYEPGKTYTSTIYLRNVHPQSQKLNIFMDESCEFNLDENCIKLMKFPCGMGKNITIHFNPSADKDYYHKLVVTSNHSRLTVPIIGIGARGLLELPDEINLGDVPVKFLKSKSVASFNVGKKIARFNLSTKGPFSVFPETGAAYVNDSFGFDITTYYEKLGPIEGELCIRYDTGDENYITLKANVVNSEVRIFPTDVIFEDTYAELTSQVKVCIVNGGDIPIRFKWRKHADPEEDLTVDYFAGGDNLLDDAMLQLKERNPESYYKIDAVIDAADEHKLFADTVYSIEPLTGEIPAHSSALCFFGFSPRQYGDFSSEAFLDVTGKAKRIPVKIEGKAIGPKFKLSFEELDAGNIYLGGCHSYELPVLNMSDVPGEIKFDGVSGLSPSIAFTVTPSVLELSPDQYGAFYISFCCTDKPGSLIEELNFSVPKGDSKYSLTIRGHMQHPAISFSQSELQFGQISSGFPKSTEMMLINESLNHLDIVLKVDEPGTEPFIDFNCILESFRNPHYQFVTNPKKFKIEPEKFRLEPGGVQRFTVTVCTCGVETLETMLLACVGDDVSTAIKSIPVFAKCIVPKLEAKETQLTLNDCHINFTYPCTFSVKNPTELSSCFCIVPHTLNKMTCNSEEFVGIAKAIDTTKVNFNVTCLSTGTTNGVFDFYVIGQSQKMLSFSLTCQGIVAKLEASVKHLDFEEIEVLTTHQKTLEIINPSPLDVPFKIVITSGAHHGEIWKFDPMDGIVPANGQTTLTVEVTLQEMGTHNAAITVQAPDAKNFVNVGIHAKGTGSSIVFDPPLTDLYDFGLVFTNTETVADFVITNLGANAKVLDWRRDVDLKPGEKKQPKSKFANRKNAKEAVVEQSPTCFTISPTNKTIPPKTSLKMTITATSATTKTVNELYNLWTYTPKGAETKPTKNAAKQPLHKSKRAIEDDLHAKPVIAKQVKLVAAFEPPQLIFSKKDIFFKIDVSPVQETFQAKELLRIQNVGHLSITGIFTTEFPFSMILHTDVTPTQEWKHTLKPGDHIDMFIHFNGENLRKDKGSVFFEGKLSVYYLEQGNTETIPLRGEVHFPSAEVEKQEINFGTVTNGTEAVDDFSITNKENFCLTYKWYIKPRTTVIKPPKCNKFQEPPEYVDAVSETDVISEFDDPEDEVMSERSTQSMRNHRLVVENEVNPLGASSATMLKKHGATVMSLRDKLQRTKLMDFLGLQDAPVEQEDEFNYLSYYPESTDHYENIPVNELIDIVPLAGVIQAGQTQRFTIVFHALPNVKVSTTAICYIEGGTPQTLKIMGQSTKPNFSTLPRNVFSPLKDPKVAEDSSVVPIHKVPPMNPKQTFYFETTVGMIHTIAIPIINKSRKPQTIEPVLTGHNFIGENKLYLPERSTIEYMITYHPIEPTKNKKHTGTVYLAFPDGTRVLYKLEGTANSANRNGTPDKEETD